MDSQVELRLLRFLSGGSGLKRLDFRADVQANEPASKSSHSLTAPRKEKAASTSTKPIVPKKSEPLFSISEFTARDPEQIRTPIYESLQEFAVELGIQMAAAVKRIFGMNAVIQRSQIYKVRNVEGHLPKKHQPEAHRRMKEA